MRLTRKEKLRLARELEQLWIRGKVGSWAITRAKWLRRHAG